MQIIAAINSITNKPWAVLILLIGFAMLVSCKKWGIDTTIAGGVIGVASNMLTSKPENDLPANSHMTQQIDVKVPSDPKA